MKYRWIFAVLICLLGMASSTRAAETVEKAIPSAVVSEAWYKFLPVFEGQTIIHDFIIQNRGTAPLLITDLKGG